MLDVILRALCAPTLKLSPAAVASGEGLGGTKAVKDVGSRLPVNSAYFTGLTIRRELTSVTLASAGRD